MDSFSVVRSLQKVGDWLKEEEIKMFFSGVYALICTTPNDSNYSLHGSEYLSFHGKECEKYVKTKFISYLTSFSPVTDAYYQKNHEFLLTGDQIDSFIFVSFLWFLFILFGIVCCLS